MSRVSLATYNCSQPSHPSSSVTTALALIQVRPQASYDTAYDDQFTAHALI